MFLLGCKELATLPKCCSFNGRLDCNLVRRFAASLGDSQYGSAPPHDECLLGNGHVAYLNGEPKVAKSTPRRIETNADVPTAPNGYAQDCGKVARVQAGKAGRRMADQNKLTVP
jgi:hypothetical protein